MPTFEINNLGSLKEFEGRELPPTDWLVLAHDRIQKFAAATEDRQRIHVEPERAASESPYGSTIAHGFLTLSLVSFFFGHAIRARVTLLSVKESAEFVDIIFSTTIERQSIVKPCCVAEWLVRYYHA